MKCYMCGQSIPDTDNYCKACSAGLFYPDAYQAAAHRTQSEDLTAYDKRLHALFGIASECGEIHSLFQHEYQGAVADKDKLINELGDLLWFISELCDTYNTTLSSVMCRNIRKLRARYPEGFDAGRSEHRHEL